MTPSVKDLVTPPGNRVVFQRFEGAVNVNGHGHECGGGVPAKLVYAVIDGEGKHLFAFPVPYADTAGATFNAIDRPLYFMRWIRAEVLFQEAQAETRMLGGHP